MSIETVVSGYTQPPRRTWTEKVRDFYWRYEADVNGIVLAGCALLLIVANLI